MKPRRLTYLRPAVLLTAVPLTLAGCEIPYGFGRSARLDTLPPADCTERVLRETPAITSVTRIDPATGAELTQLDHPRDGSSYIFKFHGAAESHILLMPKIEAELAHQCGVTQLLTDIRERCLRVECKALSE